MGHSSGTPVVHSNVSGQGTDWQVIRRIKFPPLSVTIIFPDASDVSPWGMLKVEYRAQPLIEDFPPDPARVLTT